MTQRVLVEVAKGLIIITVLYAIILADKYHWLELDGRSRAVGERRFGVRNSMTSSRPAASCAEANEPELVDGVRGPGAASPRRKSDSRGGARTSPSNAVRSRLAACARRSSGNGGIFL